MKTDELIEMLARGPDLRVDAARGRVLPFVAAGVLASAALMLAVLGVRPDLGLAMLLPAFWIKLGFAAALAWGGVAAVRRLSAPGAALGVLPVWLGLPLLAIWGLAAMALLDAPPEARAALFWGRTWRVCPFLIALLSLPACAAVLLAMRRRAPTRPRLAGAAAGLAGGALAALVYCLHCPEMSVVFVGFWYVLGMLLPAAAGALLGPRVLAW
ncbi:NrsF family protein [Massilia aerilata]|uniref:NrsF family protein n=1 Tax=Massilia aerilata TaxID=453817 RepID=A0ABW0RTG8_9BURK